MGWGAWQAADAGQLKFQYSANAVLIWLPLATLAANPAAIDLSLVGFVTEEESMQVWATMPGNNALNSPALLPEHAPAAIAVGHTLVNLQRSIRLTADPTVNNTLDNCPTNVLFDESVLDIQFMADPAGEVYDPVNYEGVRAVVPDDVEPVLATLCAGVSDTSNSPVCQLAEQVAANVGGGGEALTAASLQATGEPPPPLLNAPYFVTTTADLWAGFAAGALLYKVDGGGLMNSPPPSTFWPSTSLPTIVPVVPRSW